MEVMVPGLNVEESMETWDKNSGMTRATHVLQKNA